uniref:GLOBIN domain-containing protein n=1 Tax=Gongylonema pulchrum TaxID=637853 RepID=A0A183EXQ3_9BILA
LINNVEDESSISNRIKKVGQSHVILCQSSFNADIWEKLGEITMECFSSLDAVQLIILTLLAELENRNMEMGL